MTVDVDAIMRPGSWLAALWYWDGVSLGWQLSAAGQLGLIPGDDPNIVQPEDHSHSKPARGMLRKRGFWLVYRHER